MDDDMKNAVTLRVVCPQHPAVTLLWRAVDLTETDPADRIHADMRIIPQERAQIRPDGRAVPQGRGTERDVRWTDFEVLPKDAEEAPRVKLHGRCTELGCRQHGEWRVDRVDALLDALAAGGVPASWTVNLLEMAQMIGHPDRACRYLAERP